MSLHEHSLDRKPSQSTGAHIAHVTLSLKPGGLERFICNLAGSSEAKGMGVSVICLDEAGELADLVREAGGEVSVVRRRPGINVRLVFRLVREFRAKGITAVHTHSLDPMWYGGCAALLARVPVRIHTQHNTFLDRSSLRDRVKFRIASHLCTHLVAVSEETRAGMLRAGAAPERTRTILNGVDTSRFERRNAVKTDLVIGSVGRLAPEKNLACLIRAFAVVRRQYPDVRLRLVGDGPERHSLQRLVKELFLTECVDFPGYSSNVQQTLESLDLFVLSSLSEGIPLALLEAMAAELPIVATRVGGIPEVIVDGESGLLVPPDDVAALSVAIADLLSDKTKRNCFGKNAGLRVRSTFSLSSMANRYRSLYTADRHSPWREWVKRLLQRAPKALMCWGVNSNRSSIAVTFDDGPDPEYTPKILDLLRRFNARATFFLVGERIVREPAIVERIIREGHEIANHSYTHPDFGAVTFPEALREIKRTQDALDSIQPGHSRFFRPPKGKLCLASMLGAWLYGLTVAMWSVDLKDFRANSANDILQAMQERPIAGGDVVLYHGNSEASLAALPEVLKAAAGSAARLVTLSELLDDQPRRKEP